MFRKKGNNGFPPPPPPDWKKTREEAVDGHFEEIPPATPDSGINVNPDDRIHGGTDPSRAFKDMPPGELKAKLRELITGSRDNLPKGVQMTEESVRFARREMRFHNFFEKHGLQSEFQGVQQAHNAYLEKYAAFYKKNSKAERAIARTLGDDTYSQVEKAEKEYSQKMIQLRDTVMERIAPQLENASPEDRQKGWEGLSKEEKRAAVRSNSEALKAQAILLQYTIEGVERDKVETRLAALGEKERGTVSKLYGKWTGMFKSVEEGTKGYLMKKGFSEGRAEFYAANTAKAARLLTTTAVVTGAMTLTGLAAPLAYAGARIGRGAFSMFGGSTFGASVGAVYQGFIARGQTEKRKGSRREMGKGAEGYAEQLRAERKGSKKAIAGRRKLIEQTAAGIFSIGAMLEGHTHASAKEAPVASKPAVDDAAKLSSVQHAHETLNTLPKELTEPEHQADLKGWHELHPDKPMSEYPGDAHANDEIVHAQQEAQQQEQMLKDHSQPSAPTPPGHADVQPDANASAGSHTDAAPQTTDSAPAQTTDTAPDSSAAADATPSADVHIENADKLQLSISDAPHGAHNAEQLLSHFRKQLIDQGYKADAPGTSAVIKHILEAKNGHQLSTEFKFQTADGSGVVHEGDTLQVSEDGKLIFTPKGGEAVTLAQSDATGAYKLGDSFSGDRLPDHPAAILHETHADHQADTHANSAHEAPNDHPVTHDTHEPPAAHHDESLHFPKGSPETEHLNQAELDTLGKAPATDIPHHVESQPVGNHPISESSRTATAPRHEVPDNEIRTGTLEERLASASDTPGAARALLDNEIQRGGISPSIVGEAIKAAPHMNIDPSLIRYVEPNAGSVPGPAVFLSHDGRLTVFGAAAEGDNYTAQLKLAHSFATESGHSVNVLLPNGELGHTIVHPDGTVEAETPSFLHSYDPLAPISESVYVFTR